MDEKNAWEAINFLRRLMSVRVLCVGSKICKFSLVSVFLKALIYFVMLEMYRSVSGMLHERGATGTFNVNLLAENRGQNSIF